jgi:hypothetical protein
LAYRAEKTTGQSGMGDKMRYTEEQDNMEERIVSGRLHIRSRFFFLTIHTCRIHAKYGRHTEAEVSGIVKGNEVRGVLTNLAREQIEVIAEDATGREEILFAGILKSVEYKEEGQYATLHIRACSYTWKMDIGRRSRSFQDRMMTYRDVAESVVREYGASMSWEVPDRQLTHPLVQYQETDYCFLRRILSHLGTDVISIDRQEGIKFRAGLADGMAERRIDLDSVHYSVLPFRNRIACENRPAPYIMGDCQYGYEVRGLDRAEIGNRFSIYGCVYHVMETVAEAKGGFFTCTCRVFPTQCFEAERIPADTLKGVTLSGRVLQTGKEMVRLHLDIDREQNAATAWDLPWRPLTGNLLYCMPERGTKAAAYFDKDEEDNITVIYNIRENGETCGELADCHDRYFTADNGRKLYLKPTEMGLLNKKEENAQLTLQDGTLLQAKTCNKMSVLAEGQVELRGKQVILQAAKEATLVRRDLVNPAVINLCNAFDSTARESGFKVAVPEVGGKKRKSPAARQAALYPDGRLVSAVLGNIPDQAGDNARLNPAMESILDSMPLIMPIQR